MPFDGEAFGRQWTDRTWPRSHKEIAESSNSALLFVHPAKVKTGALIRDTKRPIAVLTDGVPEAAELEEAGPPSDPSQNFTPTQVQLIELLQFLNWIKQGLSEFRLGFIISAWDVVMKQGATTPDQWLRTHLPMLNQFLAANRESIRSRIYGVSAQGGDIVKDAERLRKTNNPSERIVVVEETSRSSDITIPVRWVMGMCEE